MAMKENMKKKEITRRVKAKSEKGETSDHLWERFETESKTF